MNQPYIIRFLALCVGFSLLVSVEASRLDRFGLPKEFSSRYERDSSIINVCGRESNVQKDKYLGKGFFGAAYLVPIDENSPNRGSAVLKVPRSDSKHYAFLREIRNHLRAGEHPNVAKVLGICTDPKSPLIMVEYLEGGSLDSWLNSNFPNQNAPPVETQFKLLSQLADALYWVERRKLVHYDVATRNMVVQGDVAAPVLKLIDFGIAKARTDTTDPDVAHDDVELFCKLAWTLAQGEAGYNREHQDLKSVQRLERDIYLPKKDAQGPSNPAWIPKLLRMCIQANRVSQKTKRKETSMRRISQFLGGLVPRPKNL